VDFDTRVEARRAIFEYIESFSNLHRRHSAIGVAVPVTMS
jgi:transposase InsO family protein